MLFAKAVSTCRLAKEVWGEPATVLSGYFAGRQRWHQHPEIASDRNAARDGESGRERSSCDLNRWTAWSLRDMEH